MANKKKIYLIFGLFIGFLLIVNLFVLFNKPLERQIMNVKFEVGDSLGLNVEKEYLDFGKVFLNSKVTKNIVMDNNYDFPVKVKIRMRGEATHYLYGSPEILLDINETKEYEVLLVTASEMEYKDYEGKLIFDFYKLRG